MNLQNTTVNHQIVASSFLVVKMLKKPPMLFLAVYYMLLPLSGMASSQNIPISSGDLPGETLRTIVTNYLHQKGIDSYPAIDPNKKFPSCRNPLAIFPMFKSWSTVEVLCTEPENGWKIMVRTRAQSYNQKNSNSGNHTKDSIAVIVTKSLTRGHVITNEDLEIVSVKKSIGTGIFTKKINLIGRKLKSNISTGFPVRSRHLEPNWVIASGDEVEIVQSDNVITVSVKGIALQNGQKGEKIRVKNLSSERNLIAWVINGKKVTTNTKTIGN